MGAARRGVSEFDPGRRAGAQRPGDRDRARGRRAPRVPRWRLHADGAAHRRDAQFPRIEGVVNTIVSDGASGWFVGGRFTQVGGIAVANAAHIKADKTVDTAWKPDPSGGATTNNPTEVFAIAVAGSTVYIGGNFATVGGAIGTDAAAVDKTSGAVQSWAPEPLPNGAQGSVRALLASGSKVYMSGRFSGVKALNGGPPVTRTNAAAVDATTGEAGAWIPESAGAQNRVNTIVADGSRIYLGGSFVQVTHPTGTG
jgi:hypothetical protein